MTLAFLFGLASTAFAKTWDVCLEGPPQCQFSSIAQVNSSEAQQSGGIASGDTVAFSEEESFDDATLNGASGVTYTSAPLCTRACEPRIAPPDWAVLGGPQGALVLNDVNHDSYSSLIFATGVTLYGSSNITFSASRFDQEVALSLFTTSQNDLVGNDNVTFTGDTFDSGAPSSQNAGPAIHSSSCPNSPPDPSTCTPTQNITVSDSSFNDWYQALQIGGSDSYWTIEGNSITNTARDGIYIDRLYSSGGYYEPGNIPVPAGWETGDVITNNTITDTGEYPAQKCPTDPGVLSDTGHSHGIYDNSIDTTIEDNTISNFENSGISVRFNDSVVENNIINGANPGLPQGTRTCAGANGISYENYDPTSDQPDQFSTWAYNRIENVSTAGFYVEGGESWDTTGKVLGPLENFVIANNAIWMPTTVSGSGAAKISYEYGSGSLSMANNVAFGSTDYETDLCAASATNICSSSWLQTNGIEANDLWYCDTTTPSNCSEKWIAGEDQYGNPVRYTTLSGYEGAWGKNGSGQANSTGDINPSNTGNGPLIDTVDQDSAQLLEPETGPPASPAINAGVTVLTDRSGGLQVPWTKTGSCTGVPFQWCGTQYPDLGGWNHNA